MESTRLFTGIVVNFLLFVVISLSPLDSSAEEEINPSFIFNSPSGNFSVTIREISHIKYAFPRDIDEVNHVSYSIIFYDKRNGLGVNSIYNDVYGWGQDQKPTPVSKIYASFEWSPKEDFVILPEERWAGAPASPYRTAINLNSNLNWSIEKNHIDIVTLINRYWSTGTVHMNIVTWIDDFLVIGDLHDDCEFSVVMFDGRTGRQDTVKESETPIGFSISSFNWPVVIIESMLDNCSSEEVAERFSKECQAIDLKSRARQKVPCPE